MLTSVGQVPLSQLGSTQPLYPSVSLQQSYIPSVQLPSAAPIVSSQQSPRASLTPQPDLMATIQEEGRRIQPEVNNAIGRIGQEAQGFIRWLFAPMRY